MTLWHKDKYMWHKWNSVTLKFKMEFDLHFRLSLKNVKQSAPLPHLSCSCMLFVALGPPSLCIEDWRKNGSPMVQPYNTSICLIYLCDLFPMWLVYYIAILLYCYIDIMLYCYNELLLAYLTYLILLCPHKHGL